MAKLKSPPQPAPPVAKQISLSSRAKIRGAGKNYDCVRFTATPEMTESKSVSYVDISDVRLPASILIYMGSPSRQYNINAKFLSRSMAEADITYKYINILRAWCDGKVTGLNYKTKEVTTKNTNQFAKKQPDPPPDPPKTPVPPNTPPPPTVYDGSGVLFDSSTPEIVLLAGYGGTFNNIPTVIRSLNFSFPSDVSYTQTSNGVWLPVIHDVSIQLQEAREVFSGTGSIGSFSLPDFKAGTLAYW